VQWLGQIARQANVPFTCRTHSFESIWDEAGPAPAHLPLVAPLINDDWCLGILAFPFTRANFERAGIRGEKIHDCHPAVAYGRFHDRSPNGEAVMGTGIAQPRKNLRAFIELAAATPGMSFNLYPLGFGVEELREINERLGGPARIFPPVEPAEMPREYKKHRWLVVTASEISSRGWPVSVAEAQASGVGVCAPDLRPDMKEYVGECGFLYDSIDEAREIISRPFPEEMRQAGFEHARKSDIRQHRHVLTDLWRRAVADG
jgi:glycosyltransferase involved in cell wall biosynthesis